MPRLWVEQNLEAIRRDFPAPTVHARNLWHLSAVMWDAYAAFSPDAVQYFDAVERQEVSDRGEATAAAMSAAAHRLLTYRYEFATGGPQTLNSLDDLLVSLCQAVDDDPDPDSPAGIGRAIADAAIELGNNDGASEINRYVDLSYSAVNPPLVVASDDIEMVDPNRWQPLQLRERITQNGQPLGDGLQVFIGSNWGSVASFALPAADADGMTIDPGPPPLFGTPSAQEYVDAAIEVIDYADLLGGERGETVIDIGPGTRGNVALGETVGSGHRLNPSTGEPYASNEVPHADYGRAIAEFWADGPDSETPPGHWNTLAIEVSDRLSPAELRWAGEGEPLDRIDWDVRLFFVLNAALHDSAIAVWGSKRAYDYARPISMIRYLGNQGADALTPTPGLVEVVTTETAAPGARHSGLEVGTLAVKSWLGPPENPRAEVAGVGWRSAAEWMPYQRPTFVSPAFAGYVSGHSGFSRAAAEVLTRATGDGYFPGGLHRHRIRAGALLHEEGPSVDVELQWATYRDAADEAGESRRYGGIHVAADDIAGRMMGAEVGRLAWDAAQRYVG